MGRGRWAEGGRRCVLRASLRDDVRVGRALRLELVEEELDEPPAAAERAEQRELGDLRPDHPFVVGVARVQLRLRAEARADGCGGGRRL